MSHGRRAAARRTDRRRVLQGGAGLLAAALLPASPLGAAQSDKASGGAALDAADLADVARVESYLNRLRSLSARFVQLGPGGELSRGRFYLRRPGRLRFEYEPPSPLLIVADGLWVVLYDRELEQVSRFPLAETPLAVLAADTVDLSNSITVTEVARQPGIMRVRVVDQERADEGWLSLTFSDPPLALRQWHVRDAQGGVTSVALQELQSNVDLDPELFVFIDPAPFRE